MRLMHIFLMVTIGGFTPLLFASADRPLPTDERFASGRQAQLNGEWEQAIAYYDQATEPFLKNLGILYGAECLLKQGQRSESLDRVNTLLENPDDEIDPFLGEAYLLRAWILAQAGENEAITSALSDLDHVETWFQMDRPAPQAPITPGQLHPAFTDAADIPTTRTASWYAPLIFFQAQMLKAYLLLEKGNAEQASAALNDLDPDNVHGAALSTMELKKLQQRIRQGHLVLPASAREMLLDDDGHELKLAFYLLATNQTDQAYLRFQEIHKRTAEGKGIPDTWAASEIGLAGCELRFGRPRDAAKRLVLFEGILRGSLLAEHGRFFYANVLAGNPSTRSDAIRIYDQLKQSRHADVRNDAAHCRNIVSEDRDKATSMNSLALPLVEGLMYQTVTIQPYWLPQATSTSMP